MATSITTATIPKGSANGAAASLTVISGSKTPREPDKMKKTLAKLYSDLALHTKMRDQVH